MDAAFTARLPFEMFDRIRDVNFLSIDSRFHQGLIQQSAGRTNKGLPLEVLPITWLLAYKDNFCAGFALPKDGLRSALPQVASLAVLRSLLQRRNGRMQGNQKIGRFRWLALGHAFMLP